MKTKNVRGISFDLWGTLIKSNPTHKKARATVISSHLLNRHHIVVDAVDVFTEMRAFEKMLDFYSEATGKQMPVDDAYATMLRMFGVSIGLAESARELQDELKELFKLYKPHFIEGSKETLAVLRMRGIRVGLCSNTSLIRGKDLVEVLNLDNLFDCLVFSDEREYCKPDYRMFVDVFSGMRTTRDILHVGDNPHTDGAVSRFYAAEAIIVNQPNTPKIGELVNHLKEEGWLK